MNNQSNKVKAVVEVKPKPIKYIDGGISVYALNVLIELGYKVVIRGPKF